MNYYNKFTFVDLQSMSLPKVRIILYSGVLSSELLPVTSITCITVNGV